MKTERTIIPRFKMITHLLMSDAANGHYRDEKLGVNLLVVTPKINGEWGKETRIYTIDGDTREFLDSKSFMDALLEKLNDP